MLGLLAALTFKLEDEFTGWGKFPKDEDFLCVLLDMLLLPLLTLLLGEVLA